MRVLLDAKPIADIRSKAIAIAVIIRGITIMDHGMKAQMSECISHFDVVSGDHSIPMPNLKTSSTLAQFGRIFLFELSESGK